MAIVSPAHGYLFVHSPRTGGTAISEGVLIPHLGGEQVPGEDLRGEDGRVIAHRKHLTLKQLVDHGFVSREQASTWFVFSSVRNPYDLEVSHYLNQRAEWERHGNDPHWVNTRKIARGARIAAALPFRGWLGERYASHRRSPRLRRRSKPKASAYLDAAGLVMRFEHLQEDFDLVLERLGLGRWEIPYRNVTPDRGKEYRPYYDDRSRRLVASVYREIIRRFDYEF